MIPIKCEIVSYSDTRQIDTVYDKDGNVKELVPVPGSQRTVLRIQVPSGEIISAEIAPEDLGRAVAAGYPPPPDGATLVFESDLTL